MEEDGLERIAEKISSIFKIEKKKLHGRQRGGNASLARKVFAYIAAKEYKAPVQAVAEYLGVSPVGIYAMLNQGRKLVEERKIVV